MTIGHDAFIVTIDSEEVVYMVVAFTMQVSLVIVSTLMPVPYPELSLVESMVGKEIPLKEHIRITLKDVSISRHLGG
jgi:hypothetical protein